MLKNLFQLMYKKRLKPFKFQTLHEIMILITDIKFLKHTKKNIQCNTFFKFNCKY